MSDLDAPSVPIRDYWGAVRLRLGADVLGERASSTEPPEAWSFGDGPELADRLLGLVRQGLKTGTSSAVADYAPGETFPVRGDLVILLDGAGLPRALIRITDVLHTRFCDVTEEFAHSEGEDERTLAAWRREHSRFWRRSLGEGFHDEIDVICETFEVLDR